MKKLDASYYIDQHYLFAKKENLKDGKKDYYLTGYYYFALELLSRNGKILRETYPYSDISYLERSFNIYKADPIPCDLKPVAAIFGLLGYYSSQKLPIRELLDYDSSLWVYYLSSKSTFYSILLYFYDIFFGIVLLSKKQITMQDIVYLLYRRSLGFNPVMWFISKLVNSGKLKKIVENYFDVRKKMPPFDELYVKLIDLYC